MDVLVKKGSPWLLYCEGDDLDALTVELEDKIVDAREKSCELLGQVSVSHVMVEPEHFHYALLATMVTLADEMEEG